MKDALTQSTAELAAWQRPGWADRLAYRLIDRHLNDLQHGRLTVMSPMGTRTYGRSDELTATIVMDAPAFRRLLTGGTLAAARSYVRGEWQADDLTAACRILARNLEVTDGLERGWARLTKPFFAAAHWARRNTRRGSRRNIEAHYDLGNDFFRLFLDETMTYSCAVFEPDTASLAEASLAKIDRLCQKLDLRPRRPPAGDRNRMGRVRDPRGLRGTAAGSRPPRSRSSSTQLASQRVADAGLADRITVLLSDYRDLTGTYDKLVSVEMIEAVGADFLDTFFAQCARLVRPGGRIALQAITIPDARYAEYVRSVDFIRQDVFPGSCLVSVGGDAAIGRPNRDPAGRQPSKISRPTTPARSEPGARTSSRAWMTFARSATPRSSSAAGTSIWRRARPGFAERTTGLVQVVWTKEPRGRGRGAGASRDPA